MVNNDWHDESRRTLGMYTSDDNEAFLIWFHAGDRPIEIILPSVRWGESWHVVASTALPGEIPDEAYQQDYRLLCRADASSSCKPPLSA